MLIKTIYSKTRYLLTLLSFLFVSGDSLANQAIVLAGDGKSMDNFGYSAAIYGNTLLVGAHRADIDGVIDAGAAYVYVMNDEGWSEQAKLVVEPFFEGDTLGGIVALNNNIAVLGMMRRDEKGKDSGAVVTFEREMNKWEQRQILTASDTSSGDAFGQTIALNERFLVIGAPRHDASGEDSGAAYVFERLNDEWHYQTKLVASHGKTGDLFGISVAIDGHTILVGADLDDERAEDAGAVYVFTFNNTQWKQEAKLMASDGGKEDIFGVRVALSKDTALISARRDDTEELGVDAGSAYIFTRKKGVWVEQVKLVSPDGKADDRFGRGVALSEDIAIISAMNNDENGPDSGAVYVFANDEAGWRYVSKFVASGGMPDDKFGWNLGLSGNRVVVATPHHDTNGENSGAVFIQELNTQRE